MEESSAYKLLDVLNEENPNIVTNFAPTFDKNLYCNFIRRKVALLERLNTPYALKLFLYPVIDEFCYNKRIMHEIFLSNPSETSINDFTISKSNSPINKNQVYFHEGKMKYDIPLPSNIATRNPKNPETEILIKKNTSTKNIEPLTKQSSPNPKTVDNGKSTNILLKKATKKEDDNPSRKTMKPSVAFINAGGLQRSKVIDILRTSKYLNIHILCILETWQMDLQYMMPDDEYKILDNIPGLPVKNSGRYQKGFTLLVKKDCVYKGVITSKVIEQGFELKIKEDVIFFIYKSPSELLNLKEPQASVESNNFRYKILCGDLNLEKDTQKNIAEKGKILELGIIKQEIEGYTYSKQNYFTSPDEIYTNTNNISIFTERIGKIEHSLVGFVLDFEEKIMNSNNNYDKGIQKTSQVLVTNVTDDDRCLAKKYLESPGQYYLRHKTIAKMHKDEPEIIAKNLYNNYTVYRNITRAVIETFKKAILKTMPSKGNSLGQGVDNESALEIQPTKKILDETTDNTVIINRGVLQKTRKALKVEYKKLKGKHTSINFNGGDDRCLSRLTRDILRRLSSNDPGTLIDDDSNRLQPEKKAEFFEQNFFKSSIDTNYNLSLSHDFQITEYEILNTLKNLKTRKAADIYSFRNEFFKTENRNIVVVWSAIFTQHLKEFVDTDREMKEVKLVAIPKGRDAFRPICINSCLKSIIDSITLYRLLEWVEDNKIISNRQIGFMRNSNIYDHIIVIKELIKRSDNSAVVNFIDLEKAYNNIERSILYDKLIRYYNIPKDILTLITISIEKNFINVNGEDKSIEKGLPQGNKICPLLFNLFINDIVHAMKRFRNNLFLFADDIAVITYHEDMSTKAMETMNNYCKKNLLKISVKKSVTLNCRKDAGPVMLEGSPLADVESFKYLGIYLNKKGIDCHLNINECRKILFLKSFYLRNYIERNGITNMGVIVNLTKMFILSNINFYWPLGLENQWSVKQLEILTKKTFRIIMNLQQRFPSLFIHAVSNTEEFETSLARYAKNFTERIGSLPEDSLIKEWLRKGVKICKGKSRLIKLSEEGNNLESKTAVYKKYQIETFGRPLYEKVPFESGWSIGIWKMIMEKREEVKDRMERYGVEDQEQEEDNENWEDAEEDKLASPRNDKS